MAATWAALCGINLLWSVIIWSSDQFDQSSDQTIKDVTAVSWENTFYQACKTDCKVPGESTGISIQSRWKDQVWFVCRVRLIITTAPGNEYTMGRICVFSLVADLPSRLFNAQGSTKAHCTKAWHCEGPLFPLVEDGVSAPPGITGCTRHCVSFPQDLGNFHASMNSSFPSRTERYRYLLIQHAQSRQDNIRVYIISIIIIWMGAKWEKMLSDILAFFWTIAISFWIGHTMPLQY